MTTKTSKGQTLSVTAYQKIKEQIVTLKLAPGQQVDEAGLAKELGIGRTPIREAFFRLASENLLQVVQGRGFFVRDITLSDLKDLFEAMLILERAAVALAARRITAAQLDALREKNEQLLAAAKKNDHFEATLSNSKFHRTLYKASHNEFLISALNNIQVQTQRLIYLCYHKDVANISFQSHAQASYDDHVELMDHLENGRQKEVIACMTRHMRLFQKRVNQLMVPSEETLDRVTYTDLE